MSKVYRDYRGFRLPVEQGDIYYGHQERGNLFQQRGNATLII
jgi:hypothetical protein